MYSIFPEIRQLVYQVEAETERIGLQSWLLFREDGPRGIRGSHQRPEQGGHLLTSQTPGSGFSLLEPAAPVASGRGLLPCCITQVCQED